jgi:hypothetical protein
LWNEEEKKEVEETVVIRRRWSKSMKCILATLDLHVVEEGWNVRKLMAGKYLQREAMSGS